MLAAAFGHIQSGCLDALTRVPSIGTTVPAPVAGHHVAEAIESVTSVAMRPVLLRVIAQIRADRQCPIRSELGSEADVENYPYFRAMDGSDRPERTSD